jgi:cell wall-associated NlpC family hydrolase
MIRLLLSLLLSLGLLHADDRATYRSPYSVKFTFSDEELIGDLLKGPRSDVKDQSSVKYANWNDLSTRKRYGSWGPPAKHYNAPASMAGKSPEWLRERVIATALRFVGLPYQHHHIPEWSPPPDWPKSSEAKGENSPGLDCSNFTAFVYNLALGIKPTGGISEQGAMTECEGPGANRTLKAKRIEKPASIEEATKTLKTGDLLYITSSDGSKIAHVVLWVGGIGQNPNSEPLIIDSTGEGNHDSAGATIPNGVYLRPMRTTGWYWKRLSHALRLLPE